MAALSSRSGRPRPETGNMMDVSKIGFADVQPLNNSTAINQSAFLWRPSVVLLYSSCLGSFEFFYFDDSFLRNVNSKTNLVSSFESFQLRRRLNAIAHRHRAHKAFDFSMIDDYLTAARDCCNDLAFAEESIQSGHPACSTIT